MISTAKIAEWNRLAAEPEPFPFVRPIKTLDYADAVILTPKTKALLDMARTAIPALIEEVERLTREVAGERDARERLDSALRQKDAAMGKLMAICTDEQLERAGGGMS